MPRPSRPLVIVALWLAAALGATRAGAATASPPPTPEGSGSLAAAALTPSALALPVADAGQAVATASAADSGVSPNGSPQSGSTVAGGVWRSLAVPGWGQLDQGHRDLGLAFGAVEAGLITTLFVSIGQGHLRRGASEETASLFAGIDLDSRDDGYRRRVSDYRSSDEYNRLVVYRDAASLYYGDPVNYDRYIREHSLTGADAWSWESDEAWATYRQERRASERAFQHARFAAAGMLVNRVASAITAAAMARKSAGRQAATRRADAVALGGIEWSAVPTAGFGIEHRLAWVHRF